MTEVVLKSGQNQATFLPLQGMNMISLIHNGVQLIDQETKPLFLERFAGLGPLIGPHFYRQKEKWIATGFDTSLFPHIARVQKNGTKDPFSHGIGRYAPWNYSTSETKIEASLCGDDRWHNIALKDLEGADFQMHFTATLSEKQLKIDLSVTCEERPCLIGLHTYYAIGKGMGNITAHTQEEYNDGGIFKPIPEKWHNRSHSHLKMQLSEPLDYGFLPLDKKSGRILFESEDRSILISFQSENESSFQIWHPKDSRFVCIEPMSTKNPRNLDNYSGAITITVESLR